MISCLIWPFKMAWMRSVLHLHSIHMINIHFLHTCPRPQLVIVLTFKSKHLHLDSYGRLSERRVPLLVSLVINEPTRVKSPIRGNPGLLPWEQGCPSSSSSRLCTQCGVSSRTLVQTGKLPPTPAQLCLLPWQVQGLRCTTEALRLLI